MSLEDENKWETYLDSTIFSSVQKLIQEPYNSSKEELYVPKSINMTWNLTTTQIFATARIIFFPCIPIY